MHGSGGARNKKLGLIRYLAWITCGIPQDTPHQYARYVTMAVALEQLFNNGKGSVEQRLRAAMWVADMEELEESPAGRPRKDKLDTSSGQA
jgi:hypothetical protein